METIELSELSDWLAAKPDNTPDTPYEVKIPRVKDSVMFDSPTDGVHAAGTIGGILQANEGKYVDIYVSPSYDGSQRTYTFLEYSFKNCTTLTSIDINTDYCASNYWMRMDGTFEGCTNLRSAKFSKSRGTISFSRISLYFTFGDCSSLTDAGVRAFFNSFQIENSSTYEYESAFLNCTGLTEFDFVPNPDSPYILCPRYTSATVWCSSLLQGCVNIKTIYNFSNIYNIKSGVDYRTTENMFKGLTDVVFEFDDETVAKNVAISLSDESKIKNLGLSQSQTTRCYSLPKAELPSTVTIDDGTIRINASNRTEAIKSLLAYDSVHDDELGLMVTTPASPKTVVMWETAGGASGTFVNLFNGVSVNEKRRGYYLADSKSEPTFVQTGSSAPAINGADIYVDFSGDTAKGGINFSGDAHVVRAPTIVVASSKFSVDCSGCTNLLEAPALPEGVTSVSFKGCVRIAAAPALPSTLSSLDEAFSGCTALSSMPEIPDGITSMIAAFKDTAITAMADLPPSVTALSECFSGCTRLTEASLPAAVSDATACFFGCTSLASVRNVPATALNLTGAFAGCSALTEIRNWAVDVSKAVLTNAFSGCSALAKIYVVKPNVTTAQKWHVAKLSTVTGAVTVTVYDADDCSVVGTTQVARGDYGYIDLLGLTDEILFDNYGIIDAETIAKFIRYKAEFGTTGLDPQKKNFVLWAADEDYFRTNINFASAIKKIYDTLYIKKTDAADADSFVSVNATDYTDSVTGNPAKTVRVAGTVTADTVSATTLRGDLIGNASYAAKVGTSGSHPAIGSESSPVYVNSNGEVTACKVIDVSHGGTGQTTLALARNAMGLGNTTGALPIANGGTGATKAVNARSNLGLGSAATKGADGAASTSSTNLLQTNVATAISNGTVCSTAAATAAKTAALTGFALFTGAVVRVLFSNGNSAATPTLNVNSTGAKAIKMYRNGSKVAYSTAVAKGSVLELFYDGTDWLVVANSGSEEYVRQQFELSDSESLSLSTSSSSPTVMKYDGFVALSSRHGASSSPIDTVLTLNINGNTYFIVFGSGQNRKGGAASFPVNKGDAIYYNYQNCEDLIIIGKFYKKRDYTGR